MIRARGRRSSPVDEDLRLPRTPGVFRRFWARHPLFADILIFLFCLAGLVGPLGFFAAARSQVTAIVAAVLLTAVAATLLVRRTRPLVTVIASFAAEAILLPAEIAGGSVMIVVACYSMAVYVSNRAAWIAFGSGIGAIALYATGLSITGLIDIQTALNGVLAPLVLALIGTLIGTNVGERKRYLAAIIDRSRQLLVERDQQAQLAAAAERERIAREMHDIVSHSLTVIVALSEGAAATADPQRARAAAEATATTARGALTEMRAMLGVLRDESDAAAPLAPLQAPTPFETVSAAQSAGYPAVLSETGLPSELPAVRHAISRIVQEGITNAMRHARGATRIEARIVHAAAGATVEIVNDVSTPVEGGAGLGLRGLAERVAHVGGSIDYGPTDAGGWMLRAVVPTRKDTDD